MASEHPKWQLGAVLIRGSSILTAASNTVRNSPHLTQGIGSSFHAEERCLNKVFYSADRAQNCTIFVARVNKHGVQRLARPCLSCYTKLVDAGVSKMIYTLDDYGYGVEKINQ
jgi:deoxycytidylate deaminase